MKYILPLLLAGLSAAADNIVCNANNCLRGKSVNDIQLLSTAKISPVQSTDALEAVRNTNSPIRGSTDCAAYQLTTVTPSLQTVTATITQTTTPTSVIGATFTTVIPVTATVTVSIVYTTIDEETAVSTVYNTVTVQAPAKRAVTTATIPAYASACSSPAAYLSACKCIGVSASTVTASTPTTTKTVTATVTQAATTAYTTLRTQTQLTTSTTETVLSTIATVTITSIVGTSTQTATATATAAPLPSVFYLKAPSDDSTVSGQYIGTLGGLAHFTSDVSTAIKWTLIDGYLIQVGASSPAGYSSQGRRPYLFVEDSNPTDPNLGCQLTSAGDVACDRQLQVCFNNPGVGNYLTPYIPGPLYDGYYTCLNPYDITMTFEDAS